MKDKKQPVKEFLPKILMSCYCLLIIIGFYLFTPSSAVVAREIQTVPSPSANNQGSISNIPWEFRFVPLYFWLADMDGRVESGNVGLKDFFNDLEPGFTAHFEGMYDDDVGLLINFNNMNFGDQQEYRNERLDVDLNNSMTEFMLLYRRWKKPCSFDFMIGLRFMDVEVDAEMIDGASLINTQKDWVDLIIGGRINWELHEKWVFTFRYDIGGYGWWDSSDLCVSIAGLINWQPLEHFGIVGGYKVMDVKYYDIWGSDWFRYDVTMHGPVMGLNFVW